MNFRNCSKPTGIVKEIGCRVWAIKCSTKMLRTTYRDISGAQCNKLEQWKVELPSLTRRMDQEKMLRFEIVLRLIDFPSEV